jgi:outer membrane protein assembly factor BamB
MTRCRLVTVCVILLASTSGLLKAEDWPEIQGKGRRNVWTETGILDKFPPGGLTVRWRTPIHSGYCGPAVAAGRVFVADYNSPKGGKAVERVLCLDEQTGAILWTHENHEVHYGGVGYPYGPRATPTVDGERVFALGTAGDLYCLDVKTGHLNWSINYQNDFHAKLPTWGFAAAPLVYGDLLICLVNGENNALVVALDKSTGKEVWRSLPAENDPGYSAPILIHQGGVDQLIQWHSAAVTSLNPKTGQVYWEYRDPSKMVVATPLWQGARLFVTAFFTGPIMLELAGDKPEGKLLWRGKSSSEIKTDGLHSTISTPVLKDGYIYGVCSYGQFRCLDAKTGRRIWETMDVVKENARWASAFITPNGDRYFINNDRGELIIAELSPQGYREISRTELIKPTSPDGGKRERTGVNWVLPAYANGHIIIRNDEEIIRVSLEQSAPSTTRAAQ